MNRTGVAVNPSTGQIDMMQTWWSDRISEYGNKGKFVRVLQKKPLPFKDLLDQIFGEHDVEQDERYSTHLLDLHLQHSQSALASNDDVVTEPQEDQSVEQTMNVTNDKGSQPLIQSTSARHPPRRRNTFEHRRRFI